MSVNLTAEEANSLPSLPVDVNTVNVLRKFVVAHKNDIEVEEMGTVGHFINAATQYIKLCVERVQQQRQTVNASANASANVNASANANYPNSVTSTLPTVTEDEEKKEE